jgi:hypothetical protein
LIHIGEKNMRTIFQDSRNLAVALDGSETIADAVKLARATLTVGKSKRPIYELMAIFFSGTVVSEAGMPYRLVAPFRCNPFKDKNGEYLYVACGPGKDVFYPWPYFLPSFRNEGEPLGNPDGLPEELRRERAIIQFCSDVSPTTVPVVGDKMATFDWKKVMPEVVPIWEVGGDQDMRRLRELTYDINKLAALFHPDNPQASSIQQHYAEAKAEHDGLVAKIVPLYAAAWPNLVKGKGSLAILKNMLGYVGAFDQVQEQVKAEQQALRKAANTQKAEKAAKKAAEKAERERLMNEARAAMQKAAAAVQPPAPMSEPEPEAPSYEPLTDALLVEMANRYYELYTAWDGEDGSPSDSALAEFEGNTEKRFGGDGYKRIRRLAVKNRSELETLRASLSTVEAEPETVEAEPETVEAEPETVEAEPETVEAEPEPFTQEEFETLIAAKEKPATLVDPGAFLDGEEVEVQRRQKKGRKAA